MDLKQPEAMTKEQSQNTRAAEQQSMSQTSSSSVYSSADSTPTSNDQSNEGDELITTVTTSSEEAETEEETPTLRQTSEEDEETATAEKPSETTDEPSSPAPAPLPAAVTAAKAYYEDLVKDCKVRMANKFDALEAETGLRLTEDGGLCMVEQAAPVPPPREAPKSTNPFLNSSSTSTSHSSSNGSVVQQQQQTNDQNSTTLRGLDYVRMEKELRRLKEELALKNDIVEKMCRIRTQVEAELEDLTASLFEEANKMVYQANVLRDRTEKDLVEATLKIDMLTAEVDALKLLVITSTPSRPNPHLHPQIGGSPKRSSARGKSSQTGDHQNNNNGNGKQQQQAKQVVKKSPSNYELGSSSGSSSRGGELPGSKSHNQEKDDLLQIFEDGSEIGEFDPLYYEEFIEWRKAPTLEPMKSDFMKRIYDEEIYPVFNFKNKDLTAAVLRCIENNCLIVESVGGGSSTTNADTSHFPKRCALLEVPRTCSHRMKLQTEDKRWYAISALCRNRIAAVCDLFCYLGYIKSGLVKSDTRAMYWQIMRRRHSIVTSKLGFQWTSGVHQ